MPRPEEAFTAYLQQARSGDPTAFDRMFALVYEELQHLAHKVRSDHLRVEMSTVSLVHEAYLKLLPSQDLDWQNRIHFYRVAARAMRQVLVNEAQRRTAEKRGGGQIPLTLSHVGAAYSTQPEQVLLLDDALTRLEAMSERQAHVVEYRVFAGFSIEEVARMLEVSPATVKRDWAAARAWLAVQLRPPGAAS